MITMNAPRPPGARPTRYATLCLLALLAALCHAHEARAQWTTSGTNTTTTNNVGVGTATPEAGLHISTSSTVPGNRGIIDEQTSNDGTAATFLFRKSRAGAVVQNGDNIGHVTGAGFDGTSFVTATRLRFVVDGAVSAGNVPMGMQFLTGTNGSGVERMRLTSAGNLGIGTAAPGVVNGVNFAPYIPVHIQTLGGGAASLLVDSANPASGFVLNDSSQPVDNRMWSISQTAGSGKLSFSTHTDSGVKAERVIIDRTGHVGIGTVTPSTAKLVIAGTAGTEGLDLASTDQYANLRVIRNSNGASDKDLYLQFMAGATSRTHFYSDNAESMTLASGRLGIGTTTPVSKLHVVGDITVTGNINAKYQDVAEWVPSTQKLQAGTVVVVDAEGNNHVLASGKAYDTSVAGVISAQPGLTLGEAGEGKALVATTGRVKVKVDATRAPIRAGDLLVTSDVAGVAMRSEPVSLGGVSMHRPGTIIGKALEPLEKGTGEILVLLSLQ
jgi:hypothetical protein